MPVINGLTNQHHPCQVFADVFTFIEHRGSIAGKKVAWIGDANNMLYSWMQAAKVFGFHLHISTPKGYDIDPACVTVEAEHYTVFDNPSDACVGVDAVNTDVWTSMGYEAENQARLKAFDGWMWTKQRWRVQILMRFLCTACQHIAVKKYPQALSMARNL